MLRPWKQDKLNNRYESYTDTEPPHAEGKL